MPLSTSVGYIINEKKIKKEIPLKFHRAAWKGRERKLRKMIMHADKLDCYYTTLLAVDKHKRFVDSIIIESNPCVMYMYERV